MSKKKYEEYINSQGGLGSLSSQMKLNEVVDIQNGSQEINY